MAICLRVRINEALSCWKGIEHGVSQGSIHCLLLFNIHPCDLFYFLEDLDIAGYADDITRYTFKENKESVINTLEASSLLLFIWFNDNFMKANSDKSHILLSCSEPSTALGMTVVRDLKFDDHANHLS